MGDAKQVALNILILSMLVLPISRLELTIGNPATIMVRDDFHTGSALWWNETYGGAGSDFAVDLVHTTDGGYALVGSTASFGAGNTDVWLVKTDALGNHLWNKTYGGTGADYANALVQTTDGGYAFVGYYSFDVSKDAWLVVVDASGNHLWNRTYGGVGEDRGYALVQTIDGGYALACSTSSFGAGSNDFWLIRTSADGSHEWNKTYGGTGMEDPLALIQTVDGGYALAGRTGSFGAGSSDFWLVKTDASGNHVWNRTYGGVGVERAYALVQTIDGGYALVGPTYSFGAGNGDVWLVKADASGNHLWNRTYGGPYVDWVYSVIETSFGGYVFTGPTYSYGAGSSDVWLVKTDSLGNAEWNQTYGGTGEDYAGSLIQTSDGGYAIAGGTKSFGAGSDDFWLVKTVRDNIAIIVPDDYATIQEAINNAVDGDTVFVKNGIYYEHVVVNKTVFLIGEDAGTTVIDGNNTGHVVHVMGDNVSITGFTVQRSGSVQSPAFDSGICLNGTIGCTVSEIRAIDNGFCSISLQYSQQNTITHSNLTGVGYFGIWLRNSSRNMVSANMIDNKYGGITSHELSYFNNITENVISNSDYGMFYHAGPSYNDIRGNNISAIAIEGIQLQEQANFNIVAENNVVDCSVGIKLIGPNYNNTLSGNFITGAQYGTRIQSGARFTLIVNNSIVNNRAGSDPWSAGIRLDNGADTRIRSNVISDNRYGILLYSNSPRVSVYANNVTENDFGINVVGAGSGYFNATGNAIVNNIGNGIEIGGGGVSNYATMARNLIANNFEGILLGQYSNYNAVLQNNITANIGIGINFDCSSSNVVSGNNIAGSCYGLYLHSCSNNLVYNNNLIGNTEEVFLSPPTSTVWDNDYPSGGNYWSDYNGSDCHNGPNQNLAGCDGIGDTPNVIDSNNRDNYPLMKPAPWDSHDIGVTCLGKVGSQGASSMKTVIAEDTVVHFSVFVMNYGNATETFNITTYINAASLEMQAGITVPGRGCATVNFTWNTSSFERGSYAISAQITAVPGETDADDNSLICIVTIGTIGDVDNNGIVNMLDVYNIALHFGAIAGQAYYVSNYDIDDNGIINMIDLYTAAIHYGETDSG